MRKLIHLIILSVSLVATSCSKEPICCALPPPIVITAQKNGTPWLLPIIKSTLSPSNDIFISTAGPQLMNTATDSLAIDLPYTGIGSYKPTDANVTYTVFSNGGKTAYVLDPTYENQISITAFNTATPPDPTEMKATFNLRFTDPGHTTTVTLLNGKFTAYLAN
jgi:hypothetical protein